MDMTDYEHKQKDGKLSGAFAYLIEIDVWLRSLSTLVGLQTQPSSYHIVRNLRV
jgi:hypothetical protein